MEGTPMRTMFLTMKASKRNLVLISKWRYRFLSRISHMATRKAEVWPMTVARDAPATSMRGKPKWPKISR